MEKKFIKIKHARENNLKNISVNIPKEELVIVTGVSGSGKSSLAFNVLYNEGRRRYVDSLSNYAKQFLGGTSRPDVESIEGLSPAIAIDQKTTSNNPRSTVGTITEIFDFYRLLFARIGKPFCPNHNIEISSRTISEVTDQIMKDNKKQKIKLLSPIVRGEKGTHEHVLEKLRKEGFIRLIIDDKEYTLDEDIKLTKNKKHNISIVVDRIIVSKAERSRIFEAVQVASTYSEGNVICLNIDTNQSSLFSLRLACKYGDFSIEKIEPKLFSFNSPFGACEECKGLGFAQTTKWEKLIEPGNSILNSGIKFFNKSSLINWARLEALCKFYKIDITQNVEDLPQHHIDIIMNGSDVAIEHEIPIKGSKVKYNEKIEGLGKMIERRMKETSSESQRNFYISFLHEKPCRMCKGERLNKKALAVKIEGINIIDLTKKSISEAYDWFIGLKLTINEQKIIELVVNEITNRFEFLINVGLGYLTLDRMAKTLSGGESQRIRLASQLGSKLTGVTYVLDEPSIGLHQRDNMKLIDSLKKIRDLGNTVVVVEHDEESMFESDYIIDIGVGAGVNGGEVVFAGTPNEILDSESLTGKYLSRREYIGVPKKRRQPNGKELTIIGARENNLKNIDVSIPLGVMTIITGVSGSGKSTLINEILYKALHNNTMKLGDPHKVGKHDHINGMDNIDKVVQITQTPIGKTPRSNPATYTSTFDDIRNIFAATKDAKIKGFEKGRFSFNVKDGRCDKCNGDGIITIPMHFLPDVHVECDQCKGKRYNEETLLIKYKNKTISDILNMSIDESSDFFKNIPKIFKKLSLLQEVGLGYMTLGQQSTLLSGGEAQRVKLATHLQKKPTGKTLYILDEPTTGLHFHDIKKLLKVLNKIVDHGDSMIIIEHNLDIIKNGDYIIDIGIGGGKDGGEIIAKGTPEQIASSKKSVTGVYIKKELNKK